MASIRIDRMDVSFEQLSPDLARAVAGGLEHAVTAELRRRLARAGTRGAGLALDAVDLGTLAVSEARDAQVLTQAIAARLAQWVMQQWPAAETTEAR